MPYIAARCPQCAGDLKLDKELKTGYCMHCDTTVYFNDEILNVKIDNTIVAPSLPNLENLILLIKKDLETGNNKKTIFRERLNRALEIDSKNRFLCDLQLSKIWNASISNSVLYKYSGNTEKFIVPYCVNSIRECAFSACESLVEISIHRKVINIGDNAFGDNKKLIIRAYSNSYAESFANRNKILLFLIDGKEEIQDAVLKISKNIILLNKFKENVVYSIKRSYYKHSYYKRINKLEKFLTIFKILFNILILFYIFIILMPILSIPLKIIVFLILPLIIINSLYSLYSDNSKQNNIHQMIYYKKNQFYSYCNSKLKEVNIIDFKYVANLWEHNISFAKAESNKIESAIEKLLITDIEQFMY